MEQLATLMCETRLNISKALNTLNDIGVVELHRKEIVIPSLKELLETVREHKKETASAVSFIYFFFYISS
jgi:predicted transcriptional regulator